MSNSEVALWKSVLKLTTLLKSLPTLSQKQLLGDTLELVHVLDDLSSKAHLPEATWQRLITELKVSTSRAS